MNNLQEELTKEENKCIECGDDTFFGQEKCPNCNNQDEMCKMLY